MRIIKTIYKQEPEGSKEILKICEYKSKYYIYKRTSYHKESSILDLIKRSSNTPNNIKRFIIDIDIVHLDDGKYLHLPLYKQGDLFTLMTNKKIIKSKSIIDGVICQLLSAVNYIHELGIIHKDIKPENILIQDNGNILLTDFEFSTFIGKRDSLIERIICGTVEFIAPETIILHEYSRSTDLYACILIFYEFLVLETPYIFDISRKGDVESIIENFRNLLSTHGFINNFIKTNYTYNEINYLINIFVTMLCQTNRYTYHELVKHPYFKEYDWYNLYSCIDLPKITTQLGNIEEFINSSGIYAIENYDSESNK